PRVLRDARPHARHPEALRRDHAEPVQKARDQGRRLLGDGGRRVERARLHLRVRRSRPPPASVVGVHGGPGVAGGAEGHGGERAARRARRQQDLEADHLLADAVAEPAVTHDIAIVGGGIAGLATARAPREGLPGARLVILYGRGIANGVPVELLEPARLRDFEPHARALRAIHSPSTAIVDYGEVADAIARELRTAGVAIETGACVTAIARTGAGLEIATPRLTVRAQGLVNCAGL